MAISTHRPVRLLLTLLICALTCGCERQISTGSFNGLTIGMGKPEAFLAARSLGAHLATAIPCGAVVREDTYDGLTWLDHAEGVRVSDYRGPYAQAYFPASRVASVESSPTMRIQSFIMTHLIA